MNRCAACYRPSTDLRVDRTGARVCPQCFVPERRTVDADTAFEAVFEASPTAKDVTPRRLTA